MNYNSFLKQDYRFANKNRYKLIKKKKKSPFFLLSYLLSIAILASFFLLSSNSNSGLIAQLLDTFSRTSDNIQANSLELPEITYQSEVLTEAVSTRSRNYSKPEVTSQPVLNTKMVSEKVTKENTAIQVIYNENIEQGHKKESFTEKELTQANLPMATTTSTSNKESTLIANAANTVQQPQKAQQKEKNTTPGDDLTVSPQKKQTELVKTISTKAIFQEDLKAIESDKKASSSLTMIDTTKNDKKTSSSLSIIANKLTKTKTVTVKKGDTLSAIFKRLSLNSSTLFKIINSSKQAKRLTRIKPGQDIMFTVKSDNKLESIHFALDKVQTLIIKKQNNQFVSQIESKEIDIRQKFASGIINNSLFSAGNKAGLNSSMIMKLAQIFGWDIDFALDIRKGDSFAILFEEQYIDGKKIANGNILSAEFVNKGEVFKAIRYTDSSGHTDYYSEKGLSMRKAFLRTPVEFSRISSRFSNRRKHPVNHRIRAHKGVDYAASRGTPIKSVGDGKVVFKGRKGGYGRVVILQHGSKYTTLYAHMNSYNKKIKHGSRVKQGQTIGYVGSSGLATGPHLHYEFRVNGVHRNPLTVPLPSAAPIARKYRADFQTTAETLISQLTLRKQETIAFRDN